VAVVRCSAHLSVALRLVYTRGLVVEERRKFHIGDLLLVSLLCRVAQKLAPFLYASFIKCWPIFKSFYCLWYSDVISDVTGIVFRKFFHKDFYDYESGTQSAAAFRCSRHCFRLRNDLYCVGWGVKLYSLTHSVALPAWALSASSSSKAETHWTLFY